MSVRIGTSGWSYNHWENVIYPPGMPPRERLNQYVQNFDTVEINSTFYHWPFDTTFASWYRRTPEGFSITVKAPRGLTHGTRLYGPERWIDRISRGLHQLREKRGALLVQLPPEMSFDEPRLAYFLEKLPPWLRVALEFRHGSWHQEATFRLLEQYGAAYCVMSGAHLPCILRATARLVYLRLHGPDHHSLYAGSYADDDLRWWATRINEWRSGGHEVMAYFNNDGDGNAVRNAWRLREFVG